MASGRHKSIAAEAVFGNLGDGLAGGGMKTGQVIGTTGRLGGEPSEPPGDVWGRYSRRSTTILVSM